MTAAGRAETRRWLTPAHLPNLICLFRIVLVWPIVVSLVEHNYLRGLLLILVAGASDGLDGFLAKRFNWRSRLGGLLDPAADKLLLVSTFITLTVTGLVPAWLTAVVILRDLIIVTGSLAFQFFVEPVQPEPSPVSKLNTAAQLLFIVGTIGNHAFGLPVDGVVMALGALVLVTSAVSGLDYVVRWSCRAVAGRG